MCGMHYARAKRNGSPDVIQRLYDAPLIDRLWFRSQRVDGLLPTQCWVSDRALTRRVRDGEGYPGIREGRRMLPVHQAGWLALRGPLPAGKELHHQCRNKRCWNPDHLIPLTPEQHGAIHALQFCSKGHALTADNLYFRPNPPKGWSGRECKTCKDLSNRERSRRQSEERARKRLAEARRILGE